MDTPTCETRDSFGIMIKLIIEHGSESAEVQGFVEREISRDPSFRNLVIGFKILADILGDAVNDLSSGGGESWRER